MISTKMQRHKMREQCRRLGVPVPEWAVLRKTVTQKKIETAELMTYEEYLAKPWRASSKFRCIDSSGLAWEYEEKPSTRYYNYGGEWTGKGRCFCIGEVNMRGIKWRETLVEKP